MIPLTNNIWRYLNYRSKQIAPLQSKVNYFSVLSFSSESDNQDEYISAKAYLISLETPRAVTLDNNHSR